MKKVSIFTPFHKNKGFNLTTALVISTCVISSTLFSQKAEGAVIITGQEIGGNVVLSFSGQINDLSTTGFSPLGNGTFNSAFVSGSSSPFFISGAENGYGFLNGMFKSSPPTFGSNTSRVSANSVTGSAFGFRVNGPDDFLFLPTGYTSGATISGSSTYNNATLAGLGFDTSQTYNWILANDDFIRLQFSSANPPAPTPIPEPSMILGSLMVLGLGGFMSKSKQNNQLS